jgi:hypothetical protein
MLDAVGNDQSEIEQARAELMRDGRKHGVLRRAHRPGRRCSAAALAGERVQLILRSLRPSADMSRSNWPIFPTLRSQS